MAFFNAIFVVLLVLKLVGVAQVTWFWVFFPLMMGWGSLVCAYILLVVAFIMGFFLHDRN